ncbi:hypothetical protein OGAPHI_002684 [Ogataea philodendri]|uniref:Mitochondrial 15S rRNA processing factor CCM1 n=1 Tax=Ogataea philodendri TaxID=1378263 RepID=A0A9P8T7X8_9ASCO|nr:uncharacterized protein OGAPHI_002684 [Ogataea philodendri]KAH3668929.1 hypothetical protein OGAPHI_002684 [Ogataea philodendri]
MSNFKLAFVRYTELQAVQNRELALRWCLDLGKTLIHEDYRWSSFLPKISHQKWRFVSQQLREFRRNISMTQTKFFENNFKIMTDKPSDDGFLKEAHLKLEEYLQNKDIIDQKAELFDYLYRNRFESLCYRLLKESPSNFAGFSENQMHKLTLIIDKYGTLKDFDNLLIHFADKKTSHLLRRLNNLNDTLQIQSILKFQESSNVDLLESVVEYKGLCLAVTKQFKHTLLVSEKEWSKQKAQALLSLFTPLKCDPQFLAQVYHLCRTDDLKSNFELASKLIDPLRKPNIVFALLKDLDPLESCYLWIHSFPDVEFSKRIPNQLLILKHRYLFAKKLPQGFHTQLDLDPPVLSNFLSLLAHGYSRWGDPNYALELTDLKAKLSLEMNARDQTQEFKALSKTSPERAYEFFQNMPHDQYPYIVKEALSMFGRTNRWEELNKFFYSLSEFDYTPTTYDYSYMFDSLAARGAVDQALELWEVFIRRKFTPNDRILRAIITAHIKKQAYSDSLHWFAAYSHYKVPLSAKSYGLMLECLSGTNDLSSCFRLVDELAQIKPNKLDSASFSGFMRNCAIAGDHKSIETLLNVHFPKFGLRPKPEDFAWILKAHLIAQRYQTVVEVFDKLSSSHLDCYASHEVALQASSRLPWPQDFNRLWLKFTQKYQDSIKVESYEHYLVHYCRRYGFKKVVRLIDGLKDTYGKLPSRLINQVFYQYMRMGRLKQAFELIGVAQTRGVEITSKTYSLVLQAGTKLVNNMNIRLMTELLTNRTKGELGFKEKELSPYAFKVALKSILDKGQTAKARHFFETYIETSESYLLDNVHILALELMILGKEKRWQEFESCFGRYQSILKQRFTHARLRNSHVYDSMDDSLFRRFTGATFESLDETALKNKSSYSDPLSSYLKESMNEVWPYRLRQLFASDQLGSAPDFVRQMLEDGMILSSDNFNETALMMSRSPALVPETIQFIETYLLPDLVRQGRKRYLKISFKSNEVIKKSPITVNPGHFHLIMVHLTQHMAGLPRLEVSRLMRSRVMDRQETILRYRPLMKHNYLALRRNAKMKSRFRLEKRGAYASRGVRWRKHRFRESQHQFLDDYIDMLQRVISLGEARLPASEQGVLDLYRKKVLQLRLQKVQVGKLAHATVFDARTEPGKRHIYNKMIRTHRHEK